MHIIQAPLFDFEVFIAEKGPDRLVMVPSAKLRTWLEALPAEKLLSALEREHWTGRKGYSVRGLWSVLVAGLLRKCRSLADVVRLLKRDRDVRMVCGFSPDKSGPSQHALGRFVKKLIKHKDLVEECFSGLIERLRQLLSGFGSKSRLVGTRTSCPMPMVTARTPQTRMPAGVPRGKAIRAKGA